MTRRNGHADRVAPLVEKEYAGPPPSTLAAQLVEHHSRAGNSALVDGAATFARLLDEIRSSPSAIEPDEESNHKLIHVVVEVGLSSANKHDPFVARQTRIEQKIACLAVVEIAIRRSPLVLFGNERGQTPSDSPLCLWLLPRLLSLLTTTQETEIHAQTVALLSSLLRIVSENSRLWRFQTLLKQLYQCLLDDLILAASNAKALHGQKTPFTTTIPSVKAHDIFCLASRPSMILTTGYELYISSFEEAFKVSLPLLLAILQAGEPTTSSETSISKHEQEYLSWITEKLSDLHTILGISGPLFTPLNQGIVISTEALLTCLNLLFKTLSNELGCHVLMHKMVALSVTVLTDILSHSELSTKDTVFREMVRTLVFLQATISNTAHVGITSLQVLRTQLEDFEKRADFQRYSEDEQGSIRAFVAERASSVTQIQDNPSNRNAKENFVHQTIEPRPHKRQKLNGTNASETEDVSSIQSRLTEIRFIFEYANSNQEHICDLVQSNVEKLDHKQRLSLLKTLTQISKEAGSLSLSDRQALRSAGAQALRCQALVSIRPCRIEIMRALHGILSHTPQREDLDLSESMLGKWCLQSFRSSLRELRLAAIESLPLFVDPSIQNDSAIRHRNRLTILDMLRSMSQNDATRFGETIALTLGKVARTCDDEERQIVILMLTELLGHTSPLLCSMAHLEIRSLAQNASLGVEQFLRPYWRVVAISVVKDILSRPQMAQNLAELLNISVNQFLILTQAETIPHLVLWKRKDLLQRFLKAFETGTTLFSIFMQPRNLVALLSALISNFPEDTEKAVIGTLADVCTQFAEENLSSLLKLETISTACELLRAAGDSEDEKCSKILAGFCRLTVIVERRTSQAKSAANSDRLTSAFFENHALGIMASFSDIIDNPTQPFSEKLRCLRGISQMISVARGDIKVALPQIRACLQSAMTVSQLCDTAFSTWADMVAVLDQDEDLESLVDHTFTTVVQRWDIFSPVTQQLACDTVASLLRNHGALIQNNVESLPSLASISLMRKFESQLSKLRAQVPIHHRLLMFTIRCRDESAVIVLQTLRDLHPYLNESQRWLQESIATEQPHAVIADLVRALLDNCIRFSEDSQEILSLCAQCLGLIGCLDPNRFESVRDGHHFIVLSNFDKADEAVDFAIYLLEKVLLKAFYSVTNPRAQGFLAYVMQELLKFCGFTKEAVNVHTHIASQQDEIRNRWLSINSLARNGLTPFLNSRYVLTTMPSNSTGQYTYPLFNANMSHSKWIRTFVFDLLQRSKGDNAQMIFMVVGRVIRGYDISIAKSLLPFAAANVILGGTEQEVMDIADEMNNILACPLEGRLPVEVENIKLCSENIFQVLDYLTRWSQEKKRLVSTLRASAARQSHAVSEIENVSHLAQVASIERVLGYIPAQVISQRAVECKSYARALFHWEQYMRQERHDSNNKEPNDDHYRRLQAIYADIDEPDGVDGVSSFLQILTPEQELLELKRHGKHTAMQTWYELQLVEKPESLELQVDLMRSLQQAGKHRAILDHTNTLREWQQTNSKVADIWAEAAWSTSDWTHLRTVVQKMSATINTSFNVSLGKALLNLKDGDGAMFLNGIHDLEIAVAKTLTNSATTTLQTNHDRLLKLHMLHDLKSIQCEKVAGPANFQTIHNNLTQRIRVLGTFVPDKQYVLALQRAGMQLALAGDGKERMIAASWMMTAKLARKSNAKNVAYDALLHASRLGDDSAKIEQARLLWKEGEQRRAIQSLQGAITANAFAGYVDLATVGNAQESNSISVTASTRGQEQNLLVAKAHLLLAKWLDQSGQTQSTIVNQKYQYASRAHSQWEKGLYHLGRFYNKLLETEKSLPVSKQNHTYLGGETAKLVIENYLRSLCFGCKYLSQTLPRLLTLWLDFGVEATKAVTNAVPDDVRLRATNTRSKMLETMNKQVKKYVDKIPSYIFFTSLAQMMTRISHPNPKIYDILALIISKVVASHPQQALWPLLASMKSSSPDRASRGLSLVNKLKDNNRGKSVRADGQTIDLRSLVVTGQRMSEMLLFACEVALDGKATQVSLARDLGFNPKICPCALVVPLQKTLTASLPNPNDGTIMKNHKAFPASKDAVTISSFLDEVLVLSSLQRPRKLTVRGSDGRKYGLLCKPNDDLRKDQRLMEFNTMINRSLKKDAESGKRRLYVRTYAVTPLNEACGLIEWVDGLKPMRDILVSAYRSKGIRVDYNTLRGLLDEACSTADGHTIFTEKILKMYKPVLHEWFTEHFADPDSWFTARLRYTRSCAVASMVGHALGLGDRHGENVLLEENTGGVFHVDFNCLFEKGLTFDKPELVPFRLTHNMVDAFGAYGVEGPFRRSAECAMSVMRANEDALLTILETFVYDPTADFVGPRKRVVKGVPETPKEVLESVNGKLKGVMRGDSVPLGVAGYVDALIRQATDPKALCAMYIGWCAFF